MNIPWIILLSLAGIVIWLIMSGVNLWLITKLFPGEELTDIDYVPALIWPVSMPVFLGMLCIRPIAKWINKNLRHD